MNVSVDVINRQDRVRLERIHEDALHEAALAALAAGGWSAPGELSLCLVDDPAMAELNRQYRGQDGPTDVLAFPQLGGPGPEGLPPHLGDVVISVERALTQGETLESELTFLAIHGVLHLLGFDHLDAEGEALMGEKERAARLRLSGHVET
ncbi:MAG: rRNA maturation RNase YbeY [bacterium]|nr:rRNA maturation RNase YbeY [bacterium]